MENKSIYQELENGLIYEGRILPDFQMDIIRNFAKN